MIRENITGAGGAAAIGLGLAGTITKYGETAALAAGDNSELIFAGGVMVAAENLKFYATNGAGGALGTLAGGSIRARVFFNTLTRLATGGPA